MNTKHIQQLLERYYDGETSLAEEQELRRYFARPPEQLPAELRPEAKLFRMLAAETATPSADFDARLREALVQEAAATPRPALRVRSLTRRLMQIAAALVVLVASVLVIRHCQSENVVMQPTDLENVAIASSDKETDAPIDWSKYELKDEAAVAATLTALRLTSDKLNQGSATFSREMQHLRHLSVHN